MVAAATHMGVELLQYMAQADLKAFGLKRCANFALDSTEKGKQVQIVTFDPLLKP